MKLEILANPEAVARRAAVLIAEQSRACFAMRRRFLMAASGGESLGPVLRMLGKEEVPWGGVYVMQVHESIVSPDGSERDLPRLREVLLEETPIDPGRIYPMPVKLKNPYLAAEKYARTLKRLAGCPAILDLIHLELFTDGRTAALVPRDPVLHVDDRDVAITGFHANRRSMTLTYPIINRARQILWVVTGGDKVRVLAQLETADRSIPAAGVRGTEMLVLADRAARGIRTGRNVM
ncbi:MAG: 6-phosphogluconolactonase [Acidobacteriaceae bacterium]|nr:6-phosphogluconolactonase [Acidobacteriaceae bacterium]